MSEAHAEPRLEPGAPRVAGRILLPHAAESLPPPPHFERSGAMPQQEVGRPTLRPAYEVPQMPWPSLARRLAVEVWQEIEQLSQAAFQANGRRGGVWLVTGTRRAEGRTTLALALAYHLAQRGRPAVLVDVDYAHPQLAQQLGIEPAAACDDVLAGRLPLEEALIESACEPVVLLPLRAGVSASLLQAAQLRLVGLIRRLAQAYGTVVLDGWPLAQESPPGDVLLGGLAAVVDGALVVLDVRHATRADALAAGRRLALAGVPAWHIAENYVPRRAA